MACASFPNVFIIGAAKSGTTSLHRYLDGHPQAFGSPEKEPCYFLDQDALRELTPDRAGSLSWKDKDGYLRLFEGAEDAPVVFESTPMYTMWPLYDHVPERIAEFNPEARFIYIMRDPVERALSAYRFSVNYTLERRRPEVAVREDPRYVAPSRYATQLERYRSIFGAERIKTVVFEELAQDPDAVMTDLFDWLGLDTSVRPADLGMRHNETPGQLGFVDKALWLHRLRKSYFWARARRWVPKPIRGIGYWISERTVRRVDPSEVDLSRAVAYLRPILREETQELETMLGRRFPQWTTVHGEPDDDAAPARHH